MVSPQVAFWLAHIQWSGLYNELWCQIHTKARALHCTPPSEISQRLAIIMCRPIQVASETRWFPFSWCFPFNWDLCLWI